MKRTAFCFAISVSLFAQETPLLTWMERIAQEQLSARTRHIEAIRNRADAEKRKSEVRAKVLELIGGLPDYRGPLNAHVTRKLERPGYVIENLWFQSLPGLFVTANLYRPTAAGKHPAVLLPMGHWEQGKVAAQRIATNLALKGFVVLVFDPIGQGERLQAYDQRLRDSIAGGSTEQHFLAGAQSLLVGQSFARYRIWDGMRALDYLTSRPEVDADRIGCTGCSGGGTLTTYISALDSRVKVAAPLCYMQSFRTLFPGPVGDSEQSLAGFLSAGLDQPDYVELFAPKPWLIGSTEKDFFVPKGAEQVYEEARGWYKLYDAESNVKWVVGPGGHGTPLQIREAVYDWMIRWLQGGHGESKETSVELVDDDLLRVTTEGQVTFMPGSRDLYEVIRETPRQPGTPTELQNAIRGWMKSEPGVGPQTRILTPTGSAAHPAVVLVQGTSREPELAKKLVAEGHRVMIVWPRGVQEQKLVSQMSGNWLANTRAMLIGYNLPALRAADITRALDEFGEKEVAASASDVAGIWLLLAAAVDSRIHTVWLDRTPHSFKAAFDSPLNRNLYDAIIPGFYKKWDIPDLRAAMGSRKLIWTDPTNWTRAVVRVPGDFRYHIHDANEDVTPIPKEFLQR